jgi:hypothetical protein
MGKLTLWFGLLLVGIAPAYAQTGAQISGEVRDPSGALIPNAAVTVTNTATNVARKLQPIRRDFTAFPT